MSLLLSDAVEIVKQRWATAWGATTTYTFDNEAFDSEALTAAWVRLAVRHFPLGQRSIGDVGNRKFDRGGSVLMQIFSPRDAGLDAAYTLAETARSAFEGKSFGGVWCYAAEVREIGPDGRWYQLNVEVPFRYEEVK